MTNSEKDRDSAWEKDRSESRASSSTSAATLTNVSGSVNCLTYRRFKGIHNYKHYHIIIFF